jgi:lysophospholipase L1-like esterase
VASIVTPKPAPTVSPTATARATIPVGSLALVGLGDSVPGALHCDAPCRSYVEVYGELASAALGKPVVVENLATNDGLTSRNLMFRVRDDDEHRAAIAEADLITITIGANDWQGPCDWSNHAFCLAAGSKEVEANLTTVLDEITTIRHGAPTAIRVTTYYDWYAGDPNAASIWGLPPTDENAKQVHTAYAKALGAFNAMICEVATTHGAVCVDLLRPFNGPGDERDAGDLLGADHLHPAKAGQDRIAQAIAEVGFAPLD